MAKSTTIIGRQNEKVVLDQGLESRQAELIAVYGRRRVGKTFLIREHYRNQLLFEVSGLHEEPLARQIANFFAQLRRAFPDIPLPLAPRNWLDSFEVLRTCIEATNSRNRKQVLFFDEFPWLATPKSGFLAAFENFWNVFASRRRDLVVVLCGSAAAWMIRNVVYSRGGLHNRMTRKIHLQPFDLHDTREYLLDRKIKLAQQQIAMIYMALGGIPHYLNMIERGNSAAQIIEQVCLNATAPLRGEYEQLYESLFANHAVHEALMQTLSKSHSGLLRDALLKGAKLHSGGRVTTALEELTASGFVSQHAAIGKRERNRIYRVADEFSLFYWNWMERSKTGTSWGNLASSRRFNSWSGYAFELLCLKHLQAIKRKLGIEAVATQATAWRHQASGANAPGAQIDLVIQRADFCTHLCELKFSQVPYLISKAVAKELERKEQVFRTQTGTKHALFWTMITAHGIKTNEYSNSLIQCQVTLDDLFAI